MGGWEEAVEYAEVGGIVLDPWEKVAVLYALAERAKGNWAAFESAIVVARQNGKNFIIRAIQLACLFLFDDELLIHSAHQFDTSTEHLRWLEGLLESHDEYQTLLKPIDRRTGRSKSYSGSHGQEQIELTTGQRIIFKTRSGGKGRGFTGSKVFLDECQILLAAAMGNLIPTLSTIPGAQVYYTGSAPGEDSRVQHAVRARAVADHPDDRLFYMEFGNEPDALDLVQHSDEYLEAIRRANPAIEAGHITEDFIRQEIFTFSGDPDLVREHQRERLGVPTMITDTTKHQLIDPDIWSNLHDKNSTMVSHRRVAVAVGKDRKWAAIGRAGRRTDGHLHIETFWYAPGTGWVNAKLAELGSWAQEAGETMTVLIGAGTFAAALKKQLEEYGKDGNRFEVEEVSGVDQSRGVGNLIDAANEGRLHHLNQSDLNIAVENVVVSETPGGAKRFVPTKSTRDVSSLEACTLALGAIPDAPEPVPDMFVVYAD